MFITIGECPFNQLFEAGYLLSVTQPVSARRGRIRKEHNRKGAWKAFFLNITVQQ